MFIKVLIRTVNWFSILTYFKGTTWLAVASVVFAHLLKATMREKCPNTEFFLVHKVTIKNANDQISVFSPDIGKSTPEKTPYLDTFHAAKTKNIIAANNAVQRRSNVKGTVF